MTKAHRKKNIMIVSGGTGGHIYPSLSIISKIDYSKLLILTEQRGESYFRNFFNEKKINVKIFIHNLTSPSNKHITYIFIPLFQILISFFKSILIILIQKPDVVIGFGGYPTVAPILAAKICNVPSIIHEQNMIIGRANQFLAKFTDVIAVSFLKTKKIEKLNNVIFTGNPVRKEFYEIGNKSYFDQFPSKKFIILIYAGSLGASYFSKQVTSTICSLPKEVKMKIKVVQQVRKEDIETVKHYYKINDIDAEISNFYLDISKKFRLASLIITRSGGSTIAEILASCKPAIFIPLPSSLDNHQFENAKFLEKNNCGWIIDQIKNTQNDFKKLIKKLFINRHELLKTSNKIRILSNNLSEMRGYKSPSDFLSSLVLKVANAKKKEISYLC